MMKKRLYRHWDCALLAGVLLIANLHLLFSVGYQQLVFLPAAVGQGQWWRLFTHPFVHLSGYHLLLDAGAFFLLYPGLAGNRRGIRLAYLLICGFCSLAAVIAFSPSVQTLGFCGLSGIGHGLMAITNLELIRDKSSRGLGAICLGLLLLKVGYECLTGQVLFHLGLCGTPLAASHAGGVVGGLAAFVSIPAFTPCKTSRHPRSAAESSLQSATR